MNYIILLITLLLFGFLYFLKKKNVGFGIRVFAGMLLGIILGEVFQKSAHIIDPIGQIYVDLIKMIVIPLVITMVISSITSIEDPSKLKRVGTKTIGWLLTTTAISCIVGLIVALVMNLGSGVEFVKNASYKAREIPTFSKVLMSLVPSNPVSDMANANIIPVIIFAVFIAVAITLEGVKNPKAVKPVKDFFNSFGKIMFRITDMVLETTPYGVLGLMATMGANFGLSALIPLAKFIVAIYIACLIQVFVVHGSLLAAVAKVNPFRFFKKIYRAQVVAFTTRSSYGTLPVTIECLTKEVKISEKIATFAAPMGATMGMNACGGLYPVMTAIFVARIFNTPMSFTSYILLIAVTTIASIGTAGVPGTASIMATVVLAGLGLPLEGIGMVIGIDAIIDMIRTATNVTGASVVSLLVANSEKEFDREAFNTEGSEAVQATA